MRSTNRLAKEDEIAIGVDINITVLSFVGSEIEKIQTEIGNAIG